MLPRRFALALVALGSFVASASADVSAPDEKALLELIAAHMDAIKREDISAVMRTIHPQSPLYAPTEALLKRVKSKYDFRYTDSGAQVLSVLKEEARVAFTLVTEKVSGPRFRANRVHGVYVFRKDKGGRWLLFDTEVGEAEYLED